MGDGHYPRRSGTHSIPTLRAGDPLRARGPGLARVRPTRPCHRIGGYVPVSGRPEDLSENIDTLLNTRLVQDRSAQPSSS